MMPLQLTLKNNLSHYICIPSVHIYADKVSELEQIGNQMLFPPKWGDLTSLLILAVKEMVPKSQIWSNVKHHSKHAIIDMK